MKFEDRINDIISTLEEDIGTTAPVTAGAPISANPAQVAPQGGQQPQAGEVTADQLMQFALNSDPKQLKTLGIDPMAQGDDLFQAVHAAFSKGQPNAQMNPAAASNNQQTTSAAPASVNTAGVPGV